MSKNNRMDTSIQVLKQTELCGQQFTLYGTPENPLFRAKEIAKIIQHSDVSKMVHSIDDDEKVANIIPTPGGNQKVWMLTEDGLYEVLMQSRKPIAKQFKKGVKAILKEIRKTGGYITSSPEESPEDIMARALIVAQQTIERNKQQLQIAQGTIERQEEEIKTLAPKAQYTDEVLQSTSTYTLTQVAHDLGLRSVHALTRILMEKKILFRQSGQWQPTAKVAEKGYFDTRTAKYVKPDNTIGTSMSTVITESGRQFLHALINGRF